MTSKIQHLLPQWESELEDFSKEYQGLIIACSGGLDSTVLSHIFCETLKPKKNFKMGLAHLNYGLRGADSEADQLFVGELADRWKVDFHCFNVAQAGLKVPKTGVQAWARRLRLEFLGELGNQGMVVALAHHLNDVAETVLMRMSRGAAVGKIAGMKPWDPPFWRPLLTVSRRELEAYARQNSLRHQHDKSNDTMMYSRNRVRQNVISELENLYPGASEKIAGIGFAAEEYDQFMRTQLESILQRYTEHLPREVFAGLNRVAGLKLLNLFIKRALESGCHFPQNKKAVTINREILMQTLTALNHSDSMHKNWCIDLSEEISLTIQQGQLRLVAGPRSQKGIRVSQHRKYLEEHLSPVTLSPDAQLHYFEARREKSRLR